MKSIDGYVTKDELYRLVSNIKRNPDLVVDDKTCHIIIETISNMPTADVQIIKHGRWLKRMSTPDSLKCSVCGNNHEYETTYCPNCNAWMDLKDGEQNG